MNITEDMGVGMVTVMVVNTTMEVSGVDLKAVGEALAGDLGVDSAVVLEVVWTVLVTSISEARQKHKT